MSSDVKGALSMHSVGFQRTNRRGQPNRYIAFQLSADLVIGEGQSPETTWNSSLDVIQKWFAKRFPEPPTFEELSSERFKKDLDNQMLESISVFPEGIWAARYHHPDTSVAGRTWDTELALCRDDGAIHFSVRSYCTSLAGVVANIRRTRPRVVMDLAQRLGLRETRILDGKPWHLKTSNDLEELKLLLENSDRSLPVILVTQHPAMGPDRFALDTDALATKTVGLAYVVTIPSELTFQWTELVGSEWSAFKGAVRTYLTNVDFESGNPYDHRLALYGSIIDWEWGWKSGREAFSDFLVTRMFQESASKILNLSGCMFVAEAKMVRAAISRRQMESEQKELIDILQGYKDELQATKENSDSEINQALSIAEELEGRYTETESENLRLVARVRHLEERNRQLAIRLEDETGEAFEEPNPTTYPEIATWADRELAGHLILHNKAKRALKVSTFENPELVIEALRLLAYEYSAMRLGLGEEAREQFQTRLGELGLQNTPSITPERAGEAGDAYYVTIAGKRLFLETHLKNGNSSHDERYCLRIYFVWDPESQQVIVGWLTGHLPLRCG